MPRHRLGRRRSDASQVERACHHVKQWQPARATAKGLGRCQHKAPTVGRVRLAAYSGRILLAAYDSPPTSDRLLLAATQWPPTTGHLLLTANYRPPPIGRPMLATCLGLLAAYYWPLGRPLLDAYYRPPTANHILPAACKYPPAAGRFLLAASYSPTACIVRRKAGACSTRARHGTAVCSGMVGLSGPQKRPALARARTCTTTPRKADA